MKQVLKNFIFFAAGVAIGSLVTKKVLDNKYNRIIDEQVEKETASIKEVFERDKGHFERMKKDLEDANRNEKREEVEHYMGMIRSYNYTNDDSGGTNRYKTYNKNGPQIISPAESMYDMYDDYEREHLSYYADGVLATTNGDEMITEQEADHLIGIDIFHNLRDHFGEHQIDPDMIYVKNDETMIIYEIFRDRRTYLQVTED